MEQGNSTPYSDLAQDINTLNTGVEITTTSPSVDIKSEPVSSTPTAPSGTEDFGPSRLREMLGIKDEPSKSVEEAPVVEKKAKPFKSAEENHAALRKRVDTQQELIDSLNKQLEEIKSHAEYKTKYEEREEAFKLQEENYKKLEEKYNKNKVYEDVYAMENSDEFIAAYRERPAQIVKNLARYLDDFGIDSQEVIQEVVTKTNLREVEEYLDQEVSSNSAKNEIMRTVALLRGIANEQQEALAKPKEYLMNLERERLLKKERQKGEFQANFQSFAERGWKEALESNKNFEKTKNWTLIKTGIEEQDYVVDRVLNDAKIINDGLLGLLYNNNIELNSDIATYLAKLSQAGASARTLAVEHSTMYDRWIEQKTKAERLEEELISLKQKANPDFTPTGGAGQQQARAKEAPNSNDLLSTEGIANYFRRSSN